MRIDRYTKIGLTILVLLLAVIALKPLFQPSSQTPQGSMLASNSLTAMASRRSSTPTAAMFGFTIIMAISSSTTRSAPGATI